MINLDDEKNEFDINEHINMKTIIEEKYSQNLRVDLKNISNAFDILESAGLTVNEIYLNHKSFQF